VVALFNYCGCYYISLDEKINKDTIQLNIDNNEFKILDIDICTGIESHDIIFRGIKHKVLSHLSIQDCSFSYIGSNKQLDEMVEEFYKYKNFKKHDLLLTYKNNDVLFNGCIIKSIQTECDGSQINRKTISFIMDKVSFETLHCNY
jgi:hypothetical protein